MPLSLDKHAVRTARVVLAALVLVLLTASTGSARPTGVDLRPWPGGTVVVRSHSPADLRATLGRLHARVVRRIPALGVVEVRPTGSVSRFASIVRSAPGTRSVDRVVTRRAFTEPALVQQPVPGGAYEWQFSAVREDAVPASVVHAASAITIAIVDTGADVTAPDLAAKSPATHSVLTNMSDVTDSNGHGTFVSSLAAGAPANGEGIAGFGGDAPLLVVQAGQPDGVFTDVDESSAIVYAVDHGAKIVNLSLGGPGYSQTEFDALNYAASHGVLVVVAAGNAYLDGNPVEYPAALVQPAGSNGQGGTGLAVGASTSVGTRATFSSTGSYISLAAPGENVFSAVAAGSSTAEYPRTVLPGSSAGQYGYGSGTSFSSPEVAGAAALVWAANPSLTPGEVASILKKTATGQGSWNEELGYGVIDVAGAVARAQGVDAVSRSTTISGVKSGRTLHLAWSASGAISFRVTVGTDGGADQLLLGSTTSTGADFSLALGHRYTFRVTALDAFGLTTVSPPYDVSLVQALAKLSLVASRKTGKHPLRIRFSTKLSTAEPIVPVAGRRLVLESFNGTGWRVFARAKTAAGGGASVRATLKRGVFRVRARFVGSLELAETVSKTLTLRVR
jgi:subtilisin family serine protease